MAKMKVQLVDGIKRVVFIDTEATKGAVIGTNLYMPGGQLATGALLRSYLGINENGSVATQHSQLQGLDANDHPQYLLGSTFSAFYATLADVAFSGDYNDLINQPTFSSTLDGLTDVNTYGAADGDVLMFDAYLNLWYPGTVAAGGALATLSDVDLTGLVDGDTLVWDSASSKWIPLASNASETFVHQAADLVITSNNTLQDTDLVVALTAGTYWFEADFHVVAHTTPDMETAVVFTGSATGSFRNIIVGAGATSLTPSISTTLPINTSYTSTGTYWRRHSGILVVTSSGNLKVQARQITSSGTSVTFAAGASLRLRQVA